MKSKPAKGSARVKKFDVGGTVGALAGLGTLAFLLNREKNKQKAAADSSYSPMKQKNVGEMISGKGDELDTSDEANKKAAAVEVPEAAKTTKARPGAVGTGKASTAGDKKPGGGKRPLVAPSPKASTSASTFKTSPVIEAGTRQKSAVTSEKPATPSLKPGESKTVGEGTLKPFPAKEAAAKKAADKEAAIKKGSTFKGRSANPFESGDKSVVRTPAQKMSEGAREVQRRREEAEKSRYKKGGNVKKYANGGSVSSASKRADGIAQRGKTRGKVC